MIKLIIFDAGDILYDADMHSRFFNIEFNSFLKKNRVKKEMKEIDWLWDHLYPLALRGRITAKEAHAFQLRDMELPRKLLKDFDSMDLRAFIKIKLREKSIKPTLQRLKDKGYVLVILSDTILNKKDAIWMLKHLGINRFFANIFLSSEIKHMKPDKLAYYKAINALNFKKNETIFIGHDKEELVGAEKAGIKSISYRGEKFGNYYIENFTQIFDIVERLNGNSKIHQGK